MWCRTVVAALIYVCAPSLYAKPLTEEDVTAAVTKLIAESSKDGAYSVYDPRTGETLSLVLDDIRIVRGLPDFGWFPDVVFRDKNEPKKKYTVDFWLKPDGDQLKLMDVRIHKDARPDGKSWMMITRAPLLWWWLPTLKRQSAVTGKQAWQVMGALHTHIVEAQEDSGYPLKIADGKSVPAYLVAIYQPVGRSREDGWYFACAELRNIADGGASYAVDFKLDPDARSVAVGTVRQIQDPHADRGKSTSESPCRREGTALEVVE